MGGLFNQNKDKQQRTTTKCVFDSVLDCTVEQCTNLLDNEYYKKLSCLEKLEKLATLISQIRLATIDLLQRLSISTSSISTLSPNSLLIFPLLHKTVLVEITSNLCNCPIQWSFLLSYLAFQQHLTIAFHFFKYFFVLVSITLHFLGSS